MTPSARKRLAAVNQLVTTPWLKTPPKAAKKARAAQRTLTSVINEGAAFTATPNKYLQLMERDGINCWLCHEPLGVDITLEHLVASVHGGPSHMTNYVLVHADCNRLLDVKSVADKVRMREARRNP